VRTVPLVVGGFSVRGHFLLTAPSLSASCRTSPTRAALPFFSARAAFAVLTREVVAFKVTFLGAIAGLVYRSTNNGQQMFEPTDTWSSVPKQ
jgi:hypothetical protein